MSWTHEHSWKLASSRAQVFAALTEPAQLTKWFAEHAETEPAAGGQYRFWGKHTLETPSRESATGRLVQYAPVDGMSYAWTIGNVPTEVALSLSDDGDGTTLVVAHRVDGELPWPRQRELIDDYWRLAVGNLSAHLGGGDGIVLPDFASDTPEIRQVMIIDAPPSVVFRTLVEPSLVNQWFGSTSATIDPVQNGRYTLGWEYKINGRDVAGGPTHIIEIESNRRLVLDWPDWRGDQSVTGQTISFELEPHGEGTRLTFVHAGFTRTADMGDYPFGWTWFLGELQKTVNKLTDLT